MTITTDVARTVAALRRTVAGLHVELTRYQLVIWTSLSTSGTRSGRPSGEIRVPRPGDTPPPPGDLLAKIEHERTGSTAVAPTGGRT